MEWQRVNTTVSGSPQLSFVYTCLFSVQFAEYVVYISYHSKDPQSKKFAQDLEVFLDRKKKPTFRDGSVLAPGDKREEREKAIRASLVFLPILSKHYSEGVAGEEFRYNREEAGKPLLPVVMHDAVIPGDYKVNSEDWPLWIDVPEDYDEKQDIIFESILKGVNKIQERLRGMILHACMH